MENNQKITALLSSEGTTNQLLALQLMQSQWNWTLEESCVFALNYYCNSNSEKLSIAIENITVHYFLDFVHDYCANAIRWGVELKVKIESSEKIIIQELLCTKNCQDDDNPLLKDYTVEITNHFEDNFYKIMSQKM